MQRDNSAGEQPTTRSGTETILNVPRTVSGQSAQYWISICGIATICWLTAVYWLSGGYSRILALAEKPNELGDFLAGAFAPVAFGWLVVAVVLQAQELRAQREELIQTVIELGKQSSWMEKSFSINRELRDAAELQRNIELLAKQVAAIAPDTHLAILEPFDLTKEYDHETAAELAFEECLEKADKLPIFGDSEGLRGLIASAEYDAAIRLAVTSLTQVIADVRRRKNKWPILQNEIDVGMLETTIDHIHKLSKDD